MGISRFVRVNSSKESLWDMVDTLDHVVATNQQRVCMMSFAYNAYCIQGNAVPEAIRLLAWRHVMQLPTLIMPLRH